MMLQINDIVTGFRTFDGYNATIFAYGQVVFYCIAIIILCHCTCVFFTYSVCSVAYDIWLLMCMFVNCLQLLWSFLP